MDNRNLFLTVLEARKSKIKVPEYSVSVDPSLDHRHASSSILTWRKEQKGTLQGLFY